MWRFATLIAAAAFVPRQMRSPPGGHGPCRAAPKTRTPSDAPPPSAAKLRRMARTLYSRGERAMARGRAAAAADQFRACLELTPRDSYARRANTPSVFAAAFKTTPSERRPVLATTGRRQRSMWPKRAKTILVSRRTKSTPASGPTPPKRAKTVLVSRRTKSTPASSPTPPKRAKTVLAERGPPQVRVARALQGAAEIPTRRRRGGTRGVPPRRRRLRDGARHARVGRLRGEERRRAERARPLRGGPPKRPVVALRPPRLGSVGARRLRRRREGARDSRPRRDGLDAAGRRGRGDAVRGRREGPTRRAPRAGEAAAVARRRDRARSPRGSVRRRVVAANAAAASR